MTTPDPAHGTRAGIAGDDVERLTSVLTTAGFIAAEDEARELVACAGGDRAGLDALVERRLTGEPLAWITGHVAFCDLDIRVHRGVYVPRWHSEALARRAAARLPARGGLAIDLGTGTGAVAAVIASRRPAARVVATDIDPLAVACALANGVDALRGDLFAPLPDTLQGCADVVAGVLPYVPTAEMGLLQRDTFAFETTTAYDGGGDGTEVLRRVITESTHWLRRGGALLLELGGRQAEVIAGDLRRHGFADIAILRDEEGDPRGFEATLRRRPHTA